MKKKVNGLVMATQIICDMWLDIVLFYITAKNHVLRYGSL